MTGPTAHGARVHTSELFIPHRGRHAAQRSAEFCCAEIDVVMKNSKTSWVDQMDYRAACPGHRCIAGTSATLA